MRGQKVKIQCICTVLVINSIKNMYILFILDFRLFFSRAYNSELE